MENKKLVKIFGETVEVGSARYYELVEMKNILNGVKK